MADSSQVPPPSTTEQEPMDQYATIQPLVQKEIQDAIAKTQIDSQHAVTPIPFHRHNGTDSPQVMQTDIAGKTTIAASGSTALTGDVVLVAGSGISLSESGQNITITNASSNNATYTAGENLTAGRLVGLKFNDTATWGDYAGGGKNTTAILSDFTYVDSANPNTNYGSPVTLVKCNSDGGGQRFAYGKIDLVSNPPNLPTYNQVVKITLRLYVVFGAAGPATGFTLTALSASFNSATLTYNTRPAEGTLNASGSVSGVTSIYGETIASAADTLSTGYVEFDITTLYKQWSAGLVTNNGFVIKVGGQNGSNGFTFGGITRGNSSVFDQEPYIVATIVSDVAGQTASDGKAYLCDYTKWTKVHNILGIISSTVSSGQTATVTELIDKTVIAGTYTAGNTYYLTDSSGTIGTISGNVVDNNKYELKIGVGTSIGILVSTDKKPLYISSDSLSSSVGVIPPPFAQTVFILWTKVDGGGITNQGTIILQKPFLTSATAYGSSPSGGASQIGVSVSWASGGTNLLTIDSGNATVYWYE